MKTSLGLLLLLSISTLAQTADLAYGRYAKNGIMISLTGLAPLQDCSIDAMEGKVKSVKVRDGSMNFQLRDASLRKAFRFDLARLDSTERRMLRRNFLSKGARLRVTGYACSEGPLQTISIDRVY